jgi:choline dehydrogenase-like flavoprotein
MIIDARAMPDGTVVEADICVVGAGAAGIVLASELARRGIGVALIETGGLDFDAEAQALCEAEEHGARADFDFARLRQFGGSTGHWGGNCAPFLPHELAERDWVPDSGWPITAKDIAPYYRRAAEYCDVGSDVYDADAWAALSSEFEGARLPLDAETLVHKVFLHGRPTRFGEAYRAAFEDERGGARVFLHAHAVEIETEAGGTLVSGIRTTDLRGREHRFRAGAYVLAAGPENARLMLLSDRHSPGGIGNRHDLVGRYFMGHLRVFTGALTLAARPQVRLFYDSARWRSRVSGSDVPFYMGLQPSSAVQRRERILSCTAFLEAEVEGQHHPAFGTLRRMIRRLRQGQVPQDFARDVAVVVGGIDRIGYVLYRRAGGAAARENLSVRLRWFCEQAPNPDSRLSLAGDLDPLGQPRLRMDWNFLEADKLTLIRTQELLAHEFGRLGIGRLRADFTDPAQPWPGVNLQAHFMGGTRMHRDPRKGVVDADCRVHGTPNLYVAGGSVFPTSGSTMPTANIVALAIRLADHLALASRR